MPKDSNCLDKPDNTISAKASMLAQPTQVYVGEDEIDLLEYWNVIWKKRKFIASVSLIVGFLVALATLFMPNIYRAEALLAPVGGEESKGGVSSILGGLGGLASFAGVSLGGSNSVEENLAILKSREFIWSFVKDEKIMPILFEKDWDQDLRAWKAESVEDQPTLWDAWRVLIEDGVLAANFDEDTGLVRVSIDWKDPVVASTWVVKLVERLNVYLQGQAIAQSENKLKYLINELGKTKIEENRRALYELISAEQKQAMLANTQYDFAFRVLDSAAVPDKKIKPKRAVIVLGAVFVVFFFSIIFIFFQAGISERKEQEVSDE